MLFPSLVVAELLLLTFTALFVVPLLLVLGVFLLDLYGTLLFLIVVTCTARFFLPLLPLFCSLICTPLLVPLLLVVVVLLFDLYGPSLPRRCFVK